MLYQAYFLPDGSVLRVMAGHIEIVNTETNEIIDKFAEGLNWGRVTLSPDGAWMAIITDLDSMRGPFIEIWEVATRRLVRRLESTLDFVSLVAFSTAAPLLAVTYRDQIHLWNWEDNDLLGEMKGNAAHRILAIVIVMIGVAEAAALAQPGFSHSLSVPMVISLLLDLNVQVQKSGMYPHANWSDISKGMSIGLPILHIVLTVAISQQQDHGPHRYIFGTPKHGN